MVGRVGGRWQVSLGTAVYAAKGLQAATCLSLPAQQPPHNPHLEAVGALGGGGQGAAPGAGCCVSHIQGVGDLDRRVVHISQLNSIVDCCEHTREVNLGSQCGAAQRLCDGGLGGRACRREEGGQVERQQ